MNKITILAIVAVFAVILVASSVLPSVEARIQRDGDSGISFICIIMTLTSPTTANMTCIFVDKDGIKKVNTTNFDCETNTKKVSIFTEGIILNAPVLMSVSDCLDNRFDPCIRWIGGHRIVPC